MTPALKAMVEAMWNELAWQHVEGKAGPNSEATLYRHIDPVCPRLCGEFDLEKVARAGLEAIPAELIARALYALNPDEEPGDPDEPLNGVRKLSWEEADPVYRDASTAEAKAVLDAFLKETSNA